MQGDTKKNLSLILRIALAITWFIFIFGLCINNRMLYIDMALGALISTFHFGLILMTLKELEGFKFQASFYLSYSFRIVFVILLCVIIIKFFLVSLIYFLIGFFLVKLFPPIIFIMINGYKNSKNKKVNKGED